MKTEKVAAQFILPRDHSILGQVVDKHCKSVDFVLTVRRKGD